MKPMKFLSYLFLVLGSGLFAQSISPQVINAAGGVRPLGNAGATLSDNVGEPLTDMLGPSSNAIITQGFLQPEVVATQNFTITLFKTDVSCADKDDGSISTVFNTPPPPGYQVSYIWTPTVVCPGKNCPSIDSLRAGTYGLTVLVKYTTLAGVQKTDSVKIAPTNTNAKSTTVTDLNGPCKVKIYTGVNINGGNNGHLHIDNISEFPNNRLTIYNRWGAQLYDEKGYDNTSKFWPAKDDLDKLQASTYFYVLDLGDGSKPIKGWVELVKN